MTELEADCLKTGRASWPERCYNRICWWRR